jgi:putative PIN family toxin of toxin-antitoxin system
VLEKTQNKIGVGVKIVIDTNVFVSALITPHSNSAKIFRLLEGSNLEALVSKEILSEISRVLCYPKIKKRHGLNSAQIKALITDYSKIAALVKTRQEFNVIEEDPTDNKFLECAFFGKADFIISGDEHLLKLKRFRKIPIISPREFLDKVEGGDSTPPQSPTSLSVR